MKYQMTPLKQKNENEFFKQLPCSQAMPYFILVYVGQDRSKKYL
jgi:hypothetical protein